MKYLLLISILLFNITKASAGDDSNLSLIDLNLSNNSSITLGNFFGSKRVIIIFSDNSKDPNFTAQLNLLQNRKNSLKERDVIVLIDTSPSSKSTIRLKLRPQGFVFILIGKDGKIALRKSRPWSVREISRSIDKMPLRKQEIKLLALSSD
tara:strand:- start:915 stop:1367 length:453 start_codon:yes stop_codon:yes gene_type:complete